ncbi:hypothetical protein RchiOBHm_Chr7g0237131 [Rosa chinensis]|uniref:Uncharacterized protein n=1 Tax=Rosa chinensis TaxID=74649 RepID=A0A2P6PH46_ROSCH|nr:hypothetical protein RchiOBHm_Chr7g0237131 [Rosa chinensis]
MKIGVEEGIGFAGVCGRFGIDLRESKMDLRLFIYRKRKSGYIWSHWLVSVEKS